MAEDSSAPKNGVVSTAVAVLSIAGLVGVLVFTNNSSHQQDLDAVRERLSAVEQLVSDGPPLLVSAVEGIKKDLSGHVEALSHSRITKELEEQLAFHSETSAHTGALERLGRMDEKMARTTAELEAAEVLRALEDSNLKNNLEHHIEEDIRRDEMHGDRLRTLERDILRGNVP